MVTQLNVCMRQLLFSKLQKIHKEYKTIMQNSSQREGLEKRALEIKQKCVNKTDMTNGPILLHYHCIECRRMA